MASLLRRVPTGQLGRSYETESATLAFVRNIIRFESREQAAQFALDYQDAGGHRTRLAEGGVLVTRTLEDRVT
jgi:hypothetical protein